MILELKPEQQRILDRAAQSGMSPEEVLDQAFAVIREQHQYEDWMLEEREAIGTHIEEGFAQAERGELVDADEAIRILKRTPRKTADSLKEVAPAYLLTPQAIDDLDAIWSYIAEDNESAANRVEAAILAACDSLARHPLLGSRRSEITSLPVRFWAVTRFPNFIVVYSPETKPLQVVAVLHGKRNIKPLIEKRGTL